MYPASCLIPHGSRRFIIQPSRTHTMSTQTKSKSLADKIIKASFIVGIAHICLKFAGLIQAKCCAQFLNDAEYTAIIAIGMETILTSLFLIGEECIGPTFLTLFVKEKEQKSEDEAWHFTNVTLTYQSLLLIAVVASIMCFPDFYINLVSQLRAPVAPAAGAAAAELAAYQTALEEYNSVYQPLRYGLRIIAPGLLFLSLGSTTYVLLNGYKKFFRAAFGDASTKICIVIGLVIGWKLNLGINALCFGILVGSVAKLLTHFAGMISKLHYLRPSFDFHNPAFKAMLWLMLPLLCGILFAKFRDIFNNSYILTGDNVPDFKAVVKANSLGRKLFTTIQWLVPYALQIALFPFLCELVNKNDRKELGKVIGNACKLLLSVFIPVSAAILVIGVPLTVLIFLGGKTNVEVASMAGLSTVCYSLVLPVAAIECVLMQGAFADQKTVAVTAIGIFSSMLSVIFSYIVIVCIGVDARGALLVVSLGFVFSRFIKSVLLILHLRRTTPMFELGETVVFLVKTCVLAVLVAGAAWAASRGMDAVLPSGLANALSDTAASELQNVSRVRIALNIVVASAGAFVAFAVGSFLLKLKEPQMMFQWTFEKVLKKANKKNK